MTVDYDAALRAARERVMDALCGYGEAMFLKGNPYNKPDQRADQKAVWAALDAYEALAREVGAAEFVGGSPQLMMHRQAQQARTEADRLAAPYLAEAERVSKGGKA